MLISRIDSILLYIVEVTNQYHLTNTLGMGFFLAVKSIWLSSWGSKSRFGRRVRQDSFGHRAEVK